MAKELPYFKFEPNQWENGNIQICSREDKGLFIDLCSMYWSRLGDLPIKLAVQRLCNGNATAFNSLIEENIFKVIDGRICIDFLNEQLIGFESLSTTNSENARLGWEKRRKNATALQSQSEIDAIRGDKSREDKKKEKKERLNKKEQYLFDFDSDFIAIFDKRPKIEMALLYWVDYKFDVKKKPYSTTKWLNELDKYSDNQIIESIRIAIAKEYQGFFPESVKPDNNKVNPMQSESQYTKLDPNKIYD
jgi:hypothetical protein